MNSPRHPTGASVSGELKPCPFCGATDGRLEQVFTRATDSFAYWSVECLDCGCEIADDESQANADAAWNTRALSAPTVGTVEERAVEVWREAFEAFAPGYEINAVNIIAQALAAPPSDAVEAERERCMKAICGWCGVGWPVNKYGFHYDPAHSPLWRTERCIAAAIRASSPAR